nr:TetR/AcrR family transcriptional regulator [Phosphitispora fastidiosa]
MATDEFATHPYNKASLSNIVARAGIAKGSMYQYFNDKKDLYTYILDMAAQEKMSYMKRELDRKAGFFTTMERLVAAGTRFGLEHPQLGQVVANAIEAQGEALLHEMYSKGREMAIDFFEQMLKDGIDRGELRQDIDPRLMATLMHSLLGQGLTDYLLENLGVSMDEYMAEPELWQKMTPQRIQKAVAEVMKILRGGLEAQK